MQMKNSIYLSLILLSVMSQHQLFASQKDPYAFNLIISQSDLEKYFIEFTHLVSELNTLKQETTDDEILQEIKHTVDQCSQYLELLKNMAEQYEEDVKRIKLNLSLQADILDKILKLNFDQCKREVDDLINYLIPFFQESYQEFQGKIDLQKAEKAQLQAKKAADIQKFQEAEREARIMLEQSYQTQLHYLTKFLSVQKEEKELRENLIKNEEQGLLRIKQLPIKSAAEEEIIKFQAQLQAWQIQGQQFKKEQQALQKKLSALESESLTKEFMEYVAKNASSWMRLLPQDKVVLENAVRKLLGDNVTRAQVLYAQGFLQGMKL